jgi:hydrogenase/urease accessory protein HupE
MRSVVEAWVTRSFRAWSPLGIVIAALALPKCPLCIVAYLTGLGVTVSFATRLAPWLLPMVWGLAAVVSVSVAVRLARSRRLVPTLPNSAHDGGCCG